MTEEQRRLAAVVFTDLVGYTALSQHDEAHALKLLQTHNDLIRSSVAQYHGREIKTMGDAFLLEFESALDATLCAIEIQQKLHAHNQTAPSGDQIIVRIGVHTGDVIHRGADVFGDAVNIASRVESFAEPNGICVTEPVFLQVRSKIAPHSITKLFEQRLKNIELPMTLYRIVLDGIETSMENQSDKITKTRIAVLPFESISPDPNDSYFAEGLTEELITILSQIGGLRVIAKTSVSRFKGTQKGISQIGSELRVGSIIEGSVRKSENRIRVTVQLVDVASEEHVWANQYDRDLNDIFLIQSDIAKNVSDGLRLTLAPSEERRVQKVETQDATAHVAYLKGITLLRDRREQGIRGAQEQFELAIRHDPDYARAYVGLADVWGLLSEYRFAPISECREKAQAFLKKALDLDPNLPEARASLATSLEDDYRFTEADAEFRRAIALNPSNAMTRLWFSDCLRDQGKFEESRLQILLAEELDPLSPIISYVASDMYLAIGNDEEVLKRIQRIRETDPESPFGWRALADYHLVKSEYAQALTYYRKMKRLFSDDLGENIDSYLGYIYAVTNRREEAAEVLNKLQSNISKDFTISPIDIAWVYVGLDDLDECFKWLQNGFEQHDFTNVFGFIRYFPLMEKVRRDPRFNDLLKKANLLLEPNEREAPFDLAGTIVARDEGAGLVALQDASTETRTLFDFLVGAFIEDYMRKRLYIEQSGWRSLVQIADGCKISQGTLYGRSGGYGPNMKELIAKGLVEARTFTGHRGRGGSAIKVRVVYDREPTKRYVDRIALES
ncbi:MAG TPA: adenylate/guanylate cyclase domain-containing protein [Terriglobales bacterium]|nr:adenylate/guanylate cyclase domain-containing protein [Terriglobales bacterium]